MLNDFFVTQLRSYILNLIISSWGIPGGSDGNESACEGGDLGFIKLKLNCIIWFSFQKCLRHTAFIIIIGIGIIISNYGINVGGYRKHRSLPACILSSILKPKM